MKKITPSAYQFFALYATLSAAERRRWRRAVRSPYFGYRSDIERLCEAVDRRGTSAASETLWSDAYPDEPVFDAARWRALLSDAQEWLERFLVQEYGAPTPVHRGLVLAAQYRRRNLPGVSRRTLREAGRRLEQEPWRHDDYYATRLALEVERLQLETAERRSGALNLQEVGEALDVHYLIGKLRHACAQLSHQAVHGTDYDFGLLPLWLGGLEATRFADVPAVALYYSCYRFLSERGDPAHFRRFRTLFADYAALFPDEQRKELYLLAINYCIRQLNTGSEPFTREALALYRDGLDQKFLLENGVLSRFTFNNIAGIAMKLGDFGWMEQFVEQYAPYLEDGHREATVSFNLARLAYVRHDYAQAVRLLQAVEFSDLPVNLMAKNLLLKMLYELDEFDVLASHLTAFAAFLRRRQVSDYHRRNYGNIIRFTRQLLALPDYDAPRRRALAAKIRAEPVLSEREWLLEQVKG